ncbi:hypothetical protein [Listeria immobilis]|nr:hypothetical protein [Listeria immobilis]
MPSFSDQTPVVLGFDKNSVENQSISHLTQKIRISVDRKVIID